MFRPLLRSHRRPPRRGTAILITCFFLITIMMVTGLALVMYAAREKAAAMAYSDAIAVPAKAPPDPTNAVNAFFGGLLYDDLDDGPALQNVMRGHSIARSMYGSRSDYSAPGNPWVGSVTPWAGVGPFNDQPSTYTYNGTASYPSLAGITSRQRIVNYTAMLMDNQPLLIDPEWTRNRLPGAGGSWLFKDTVAGRDYVGKHAGYTYPGVKDFFLGAQDPYTGEVLVPSFHRDWLFRHTSRPADESPLHPANPNWYNDAGRLLTVRPRPAEHPNFPRVPPNADGSYTGDVQNCPGSYRFVDGKGFIALNDSQWMHIGLSPMRLASGKLVQPLVAALVLPLDGRFDMSVHGNQLNGGAHEGYGGYGPWAVDIGYGLSDYNATTPPPMPLAANMEANRKSLIAGRKANYPAEFNPFATGQLLPTYGGVSWTGAQVDFQFPAGNSLFGQPSRANPTLTPIYSNFQNDNAQVPKPPALPDLTLGHPAGYNRDEFAVRNTANMNSPIFPYTDLKRFSLRYAYTPDWYYQAFATKAAQDTFLGQPTTYPYLANPGASTSSNYRLDPAHNRRLLFTPKATGLDRPALAPNFVSRDDGTGTGSASPALQIVAGATKPGGLFAGANPTATVYPTPQNPGTVTDFAPPVAVGAGVTQRWYNIQAALGSVNLNRPLADYRTDLTKPLGTDVNPTGTLTPDPLLLKNMGNVVQAEADRQALAKDIFIRLCVATGAAAIVDPNTGNISLPNPITRQINGAGVAYTTQQYDALRYLAQLAVNIVDHIDNDDVSTTFLWNPVEGAAEDLKAAKVGNRAVFGIEKPRLLLNEVYSEITNDTGPGDQVEAVKDKDGNPTPLAPTANAQVRFWAELVNPTSAPHATNTGVLGTGAVNLSAYQIQIARAIQETGGTGDRISFLSSLSNTSGVFGDATGTPVTADAMFNFPLVPVGSNPAAVAPNDVTLINNGPNSQYAPPYTGGPASTLPAGGFVLVGPPTLTPKKDAKEFTPPAAGVWATTNKVDSQPLGPATSSSGMGYMLTMPSATILSNKEFKRHVVQLRRLTNPYLPANDPNYSYDPSRTPNPYVTVDMMDNVPAFDAVHRAAGQPTDRKERDGGNPGGYDPVTQRFSVGKVQPLAAYSGMVPMNGPGAYNVYNGNTGRAVASSLTDSMIRDQTGAPTLPTPATDPMVTNDPNEPKNTFGRHNGHLAALPGGATVTPANTPATLTDTIMLPFDWLPHLDRPLETQGDLFTVRDCPPHRLTSEFVRPNATAPSLRYDASYAQWTRHNDGLTRALGLLSVKSPDLRVPHGGRVAGKVNPNVIQDRRVVQGVWAPQANNRFNLAFVNDTVWDKWLRSRSNMQGRKQADGVTVFNSPVPTGSIAEGGADRPFMPFATPTATAGTFAYGNPSTFIDGDTILRRPETTAIPNPEPHLILDPQADPTVVHHPYTQSEPLRKVMNNLTTVSHSFVVYLTVGYFEPDGLQTVPTTWPTGVPAPPRFGAEVYDQIPGDMRQKFVAVIDMSNMALKGTTSLTDTNPHATEAPFFTALTATARAPVAPATTSILSIAHESYDTGNGIVYVSADGVRKPITVGTQLIIGYGAEQQPPNPTAGNPTPTPVVVTKVLGAGQLEVTGLTRDAWGGTVVSNVRPGYAGPQPGFNFTLDKYKPVVPYVERLR
ncbi:hypothetical protein GobsT_07490 [Gemmata obscuriglobus]|uniref:Uncharacterized protein n=1 Tax=Gemmata obscuriglobus TaxID=114 RepID=A0A2Z3HCN8_9BACT|nr:hypothetical protein [Gemmata obscuriglobus]AWM40715.1 hypothetical protein C1280_29510 [Gemmata obscuriglobus]QEG26014.1 hypothetical protein GobsT_07490 [Gemmata obscuriglobus]VTS00323.1 unnamed protein product [Gemmata obscuriglobus UQM 2246]